MAEAYRNKRHSDLTDFIWKIIFKFKGTLGWLSYVMPYRSLSISKETFDNQFATKHWDRLHNINELGRYSLLVGYCRHFSSKKLLDAGCGQGVLLRHLSEYGYDWYDGIDFSEEAISLASSEFDHLTNAKFHTADINNYSPTKKYDLIVFNECLHYTDDPVETVSRYLPYLESNGHIIVSLYGDPRNKKVIKILSDKFNSIDTVDLEHKMTGIRWTIIVYKS